jgi:hypothetical protein
MHVPITGMFMVALLVVASPALQAQKKIDGAFSSQPAIRQRLDAVQSAHQETQRRLMDQLSGRSNGDAAKTLEREKSSSRIEAEEVARLDVHLRGQRSLVTALGSRQELARRQLAAVQENTEFTKQELDALLAWLYAQQKQATPTATLPPRRHTRPETPVRPQPLACQLSPHLPNLG